MAEDVFFYRDGERRAVATNASNALDFQWAASLEIAVLIADLENPEEQKSEMDAWAPLVLELAKRLERYGVRSSREVLRAGCRSLRSEHLIRGGEIQ